MASPRTTPMRVARIRSVALAAGAALLMAAQSAAAATSAEPVYRGVGTVLESTGVVGTAHGAQLCLGIVLASYPPQCGGPDIAGWDWSAAEGEQSAGGTTWGRYVVTGTFDGSTLTVTWPPRRATAEDDASRARPAPSFRTRCRAPAGGWIRRGQGDPNWNAILGTAAVRYLNRTGDLGGYWVDQTKDRTIVNVRVVRNVATHRVELRRRFRGNLCVTQRGWSERALLRVLNQAIAAVPPAGRLGGGTDIVDSHVDIDVVLDTGKLQRTFDARFGRGVVRVRSALRRVG
jgi:hypothetical protein